MPSTCALLAVRCLIGLSLLQRLATDELNSINYHVALCQLFQPLLEYESVSPPARDLIRSICHRSAHDGINLFKTYRQIFTARYISPFQVFHILHLATTLTSQENPEVNETTSFCLETLHEALPGFPFVGPLQAMYCRIVTDRGFSLPEGLYELMDGRTDYDPEEFLDACERMTYRQPTELLMERLHPQLAQHFMAEWQNFIESRGGGEDVTMSGSSPSVESGSPGKTMDIQSLMNP